MNFFYFSYFSLNAFAETRVSSKCLSISSLKGLSNPKRVDRSQRGRSSTGAGSEVASGGMMFVAALHVDVDAEARDGCE